ncbi:MAG: hemolysin family protein [bacterium]|jgi:putative hemolysin
MLDVIGNIAAIVAAVLGSGFFSGSETAFVSSNRFQISAMATSGSMRARMARRLLADPSTLLSVTLVGTNVCVVLASALATATLADYLGDYAVLVSTVSVTFFLLVFGEIIPKAIARTSPEGFLTFVAPVLGVAYYVLYPVAMVTSSIASVFVGPSGRRERSGAVTREEIRAIVKEIAGDASSLPSHAYAYRVLDLSRMKVTGVMVPMDEVNCFEEGMTVRQVLSESSRSGHSRYPVYKGSCEHITGVLHIRDLLGVTEDRSIRVFSRSAHFIPETQTVRRAIFEMRDDLRHLSVVTDEYGRSIGIVTFEDALEEILGEISDEYDGRQERGIEIGGIVSGRVPVSLIEEELGIEIPEGAGDTLAGFLLHVSGEIPHAGAVIEHGNFRFHVVEVRGNRIRRVRIDEKEE